MDVRYSGVSVKRGSTVFHLMSIPPPPTDEQFVRGGSQFSFVQGVVLYYTTCPGGSALLHYMSRGSALLQYMSRGSALLHYMSRGSALLQYMSRG